MYNAFVIQENRSLAAIDQCLEVLRLRSNISWSMFYGLHRKCDLEKSVVGILNSKEIDPASGDFKPLFQVKLVCRAHNASSAIERIQGQ